MLIVFCVERPREEGASHGWGDRTIRRSSCVWGLRILLNTEGILTLPMFLLSDGSLIQMWGASLTQWCRALLSLSIIVKSLSSTLGCFVEIWWFLMAMVVWFLWSETLSFRNLLVSSMYSAVQLWAGHFQWWTMSVFWATDWIFWMHD